MGGSLIGHISFISIGDLSFPEQEGMRSRLRSGMKRKKKGLIGEEGKDTVAGM